jgi:hypothetical protein
MCDDSLSLALVAILLMFIVFYVLYVRLPEASANFSSNSPTDKYSFIDNPKSSLWSGLDDNDRTVEMNIVKNKLMLNQPPPISQTANRRLTNQEYGKTY